MALFGKKKTEKKEEPKADSKPRPTSVAKKSAVEPDIKVTEAKNTDVYSTLLRPRITEKATFASEKNTYVFEINPRATKKDVVRAISSIYKVIPRKISITKIPSKKRRSRAKGTVGVQKGGKKAYVYLKKGETIEIV